LAARRAARENEHPAGSGQRGRPRDPGRAGAILDAVAGLLREPGTGRIGMREVAERSGTSLATIYRRWPSRERLLLDAIERFVQAGAPVPDSGDLRADLLAVLDTMLGRRSAFIGSMPRLFAEGAASPEFGNAVRTRLLGLAGRTLDAVLRRARANGQISPAADLRLVADTALALFAYQPVVHGQPPTRGYATRIVDHALLPMLGLGLQSGRQAPGLPHGGPGKTH
jgi:AcrR family transcriptional regulator